MESKKVTQMQAPPVVRGSKIICLVPSLTETLLECGFQVVGRTRYCVHPQPQVKTIATVGGTKDIDWAKARAAAPDWLILDREENPKAISVSAPGELSLQPERIFATHVTSVTNLAGELARLAEALAATDPGPAQALRAIAVRWQTCSQHSRQGDSKSQMSWPSLPGVVDWLRPISTDVRHVTYVIWRNPYMAITNQTFIGSMLQAIGCSVEIWPAPTTTSSYPEVDLHQAPRNTLLLFSSEPFPFASAKYRDELLAFGRPAAIVDGELFSWFGVRSLRFLEAQQVLAAGE